MRIIAHHGEGGPAARSLWQSVPLECILCGLAVFVAAGLKLAGLMP